jgi:cytochrome c-type protein NapC
VLALVVIGGVLGIAGVVAFDLTMHATSSDKFCTSCHEMSIPTEQWRQSIHYSNASGVAAGCADCHIPQAFGPKMMRKIEASREVWGHFTGIIDTPEKYRAHAPAMKAREIARLRASDSQECRDCHVDGRMFLPLQSVKARRFHEQSAQNGKTCIDCHSGIAHPDSASGGPTPAEVMAGPHY